jgi:hypothetical protein
MKRVSSVMIMILVSILATFTCAHGMRYDGPYSGHVIDADTGAPIEGVVVLGVWNTEKATPGGAVHDFYDARETTTDKNGDFKIPGMGFKILSNVTPMDVLIFKAGYEHIGLHPWASLKEDLILRKKIKWEGKKAIIPIKKLTLEERKKKGDPDYPPMDTPKEKIKLILKEINKDRKERGLDTVELGR